MREIDDVMRKAHKKAVKKLLDKKNVVGVGIGLKEVGGKKTGEVGIVVHVRKKVAESELRKSELVPKKIDGVVTDVVETGEIRALGKVWRRPPKMYPIERDRPKAPDPVATSPTDRIRPVPPGVSIGEASITAGTSGIYLRPLSMRNLSEVLKASGHSTVTSTMQYAARTDEWMLYSNAHVCVPAAYLTQDSVQEFTVLQPGVADGGRNPEDMTGKTVIYQKIVPVGSAGNCGTASRIVELLNWLMELFGRNTRFDTFRSLADEALNTVDGALQKMTSQDLINRSVYGLNVVPTEMIDFKIGDSVVTSNRTTETQRGIVSTVDYVGLVNYGEFNVLYGGQVVVDGEGFTEGGSSGGIVMLDGSRTEGGKIVDGTSLWGGNLFAGGGGKTIVNKASVICETFGVTCE